MNKLSNSPCPTMITVPSVCIAWHDMIGSRVFASSMAR